MEGGCIICGDSMTQSCIPCKIEFCEKHFNIHKKRKIRPHSIQITPKPIPCKYYPKITEDSFHKSVRESWNILKTHYNGNDSSSDFAEEFKNILANYWNLFLEFNCDTIEHIAVTNDSKYIVTVSYSDAILWDLQKKRQIAVLDTTWEMSIALTTDSKYIVFGSNSNTVSIWSLLDKKEEAILEGHTESVNCVAVTSDNKSIVSGSRDKSIKIWSLHANCSKTPYTVTGIPWIV